MYFICLLSKIITEISIEVVKTASTKFQLGLFVNYLGIFLYGKILLNLRKLNY